MGGLALFAPWVRRYGEMVEIRVLGPLEVSTGEGRVALGGPKQRTVLALLTANANQVMSQDRLIDEVWGEEPPEAARNTLQSYVSNLRKVLRLGGAGVSIERRPPGYVLQVPEEWIDAAQFEVLARMGRDSLSGDGNAAAALLREALALWRGSAFADLADEAPLLRAEAIRLEERRLSTLGDRIDADLATGCSGELISELEMLTEQHPLRERFWGQLMIALYRSGRQAGALRAYRKARGILAEEVGIDPSPELQRLEDQVLLQDPELGPASAPGPVRHNLPSPISTFIGRGDAIAVVGKELAQHRLVTLTGVGGVGKTRLATEAARTEVDSYPDGVWLVDVAAVGDAALVAPLVAEHTGVRQTPDRPVISSLIDHFRPRCSLLVMDNCEHLIDSLAPLIETLLHRCPRVRVLCTSRQALRIHGEAVVDVPPLGTPGDDATAAETVLAEAVQLFGDRAATAGSGFALHPGNAHVVADICRRLDGIPLALELAAAATRSLVIDDLAARIDEWFHIHGPESRTAAERHRSMRAALEWSYQTLSPTERLVLGRLSVFAGSFGLDAAEQILPAERHTNDVVATITALVDKSLVVRIVPSEGRYRLLEPVRQFAQQKIESLGDLEATRRRHRDWYLALAEEGGGAALMAEPQRWIPVLTIDHDNLRGALSWSLERGHAEPALRLAGALAYYWVARTFLEEGHGWVLAALALEADVPPSARAAAEMGAGMITMFRRDAEQAAQHFRQARALYVELGTELAVAWTYLWSCTVEISRIELDHAAEYGKRGLELFRHLGNDDGTAATLTWLGASYLADPDKARPLLEEAIDIARRIDRWPTLGWAKVGLGVALSNTGTPHDGLDTCEEAVAVAEQTKDTGMLAYALTLSSAVAIAAKEHERARALLRRALHTEHRYGATSSNLIGLILECCAALLTVEQRFRQAATLYGAADNSPHGYREAPFVPFDMAQYRRAAQRALGRDTFEQHAHKGAGLDRDQASTAALEYLAPAATSTTSTEPHA